MRRAILLYAVCVVFLLPVSSANAFSFRDSFSWFENVRGRMASLIQGGDSFFCDSVLSYALNPLGVCSTSTNTGENREATSSEDANDTRTSDVAVEPETEESTEEEKFVFVTNEYITNPTTIIQEVVREVVTRTERVTQDVSDFVTQDFIDKQVSVIYDAQGDSQNAIGDSFTTDLLTVTGDGTVAGTLGVTGILTGSAYITAPYFTATDDTATSTFAGALTVGTTTASERLTVDGAVYLGASNSPSNTTNRLYNTAGSLYWSGNLIAGGTVGTWDSNGTDVWRASGNVGIGTTTPADLLDVYKGASGATPDVNSVVNIENSSHAFLSFLTPATMTSGLLMADPGGTARGQLKYDHNTDSLQLVTSGDIELTGGNVGIGTTSPQNNLHVYGNGSRIRIDGGPSATVNYGLNFYEGNDSPTSGFRWGAIVDVNDGDKLKFIRNDGSSSNLTLDQGGNVGIGTTSPQGKLNVYQGASGAIANVNANGLVLENNANVGMSLLAPNANYSQIFFGDVAGSSRGQISYGGSAVSTTNDRDSMQFITNNLERMRISSTGNVGIGTTSPSKKFVVRSADNTTNTFAGFYAENESQGVEIWYAGIQAGGSNGNVSLHLASKGTGDVLVTNGNVGIGTTTPLSKLAVSGGASIGANYNIAAPTNGLIVEGNVGVGTTNPGYKLAVNGTSDFGDTMKFVAGARGAITWGNGSINGGNVFSVTAGTNQYLSLGANNTDGQMVINTSGNVGIGTTSPWSTLAVSRSVNDSPSLTHGSASAFSLSVPGGVELAFGLNPHIPRGSATGSPLRKV